MIAPPTDVQTVSPDDLVLLFYLFLELIFLECSFLECIFCLVHGRAALRQSSGRCVDSSARRHLAAVVRNAADSVI